MYCSYIAKSTGAAWQFKGNNPLSHILLFAAWVCQKWITSGSLQFNLNNTPSNEPTKTVGWKTNNLNICFCRRLKSLAIGQGGWHWFWHLWNWLYTNRWKSGACRTGSIKSRLYTVTSSNTLFFIGSIHLHCYDIEEFVNQSSAHTTLQIFERRGDNTTSLLHSDGTFNGWLNLPPIPAGRLIYNALWVQLIIEWFT